MKNPFDILNPRMFSVFQREDRRVNYDLLLHLSNYLMTRQVALRDEVLDDLADYIRARDFSDFDDEEGNDIADKSAREKASLKLRQFKKTGWIGEDTTVGFSLSVSMNDNALTLLEALRSIAEKEERPLEYTGYFYLIYDTLQNFDYSQSKARLEQVFKNANELFTSLQGLSSNIKRFIEEMINKEGITPEEVLDILLYRYQDQVMMTVFNNLKGRDNPSRFTSGIVDKLKQLRFESFERVVIEYAKGAYPSGATSEQIAALEDSLREQLDQAIYRFENVEEFVALIDDRNARFHETAVAKIRFLMNNKRDVSGLLDQALRSLRTADPDADYSDLIPIEFSKGIDEKSLYSRAFNRDRPTVLPSEMPQAQQEEIDDLAKLIFTEDKYSRRKINDFVLSLLGEKDHLESDEIPICEVGDIIRFLAIQIYGYYPDVSYSLTLKDEWGRAYGYRMRKFAIDRKEGQR